MSALLGTTSSAGEGHRYASNALKSLIPWMMLESQGAELVACAMFSVECRYDNLGLKFGFRSLHLHHIRAAKDER